MTKAEYRAVNRDDLARKSREYHAANRDAINARRRGDPSILARSAERNRNAHRKDPRREMLRAARDRAKRKGLPFAIALSDIGMPADGRCPMIGIPLSQGVGKQHDGSPSLDRIVPELGYVPGNVRVVSYLANAMKNHATREQLLAFARSVLAEHSGSDCA